MTRVKVKVKVKVHTLDTAPLRSESPPQKRSGMARVLKGFHSFTCTPKTFICNRNESYLPLPSQPQLVLIYRPRRDGRLSRPWCEVAQAEIRIRNLPIANPALYHTATSAAMSRHSLYRILYTTGSQCNCFRAGFTWSRSFRLSTSRAAAFCTP